MYYDSTNLIVQKDLDGGDSAQREGFVRIALALIPKIASTLMLRLNYDEVIWLLEPYGDGKWIRNPYRYNDSDDFSRDQATPNIIGMGFDGKTAALKRMFWAQVHRDGFKFQNGDWASPQDFGHYIRALGWWPLYPVLLLGDTFMLLNSIIRCISGIKKDNVGDDLNHIASLVQAQKRMPTPISLIARKLYKWLRPRGPQFALDWYFRAESGGNPEIAEIYKPIIKEM